MKEIKRILDGIEKHKGDLKMALASVVGIEGSSYRRIGARMLIFENGDWIGGISGGCLEGDVLKNAKIAIRSGAARLVSYDTRDGDPYQIGVGLGCRGKIDILIEALSSDANDRHVKFLAACIETRHNSGLALVISQQANSWNLQMGDRLYLDDSSEKPSALNDDLKRHIEKAKSKIVDYSDGKGGSVKILFEVFVPRVHIIILALHYDLFPLVELTNALFWKTSLIGNMSKLSMEILHKVDHAIMYKKDELFDGLQIDDYTGIVLMSHDYKTDYHYLKKLLKTDIPYIGILGPRKRYESILLDLDNDKIFLEPNDLNRIFSPVGLDIGAKTPEEIAISVCGELIAFFNDRKGASLKYRKGTIYDPY